MNGNNVVTCANNTCAKNTYCFSNSRRKLSWLAPFNGNSVRNCILHFLGRISRWGHMLPWRYLATGRYCGHCTRAYKDKKYSDITVPAEQPAIRYLPPMHLKAGRGRTEKSEHTQLSLAPRTQQAAYTLRSTLLARGLCLIDIGRITCCRIHSATRRWYGALSLVDRRHGLQFN